MALTAAVVVVALVELALAGKWPATAAVGLLVLQWLFVAALALAVAHWSRRLSLALALLTLPLPLLYLASWALELATGRFLDGATVRFALANPGMLAVYMAQAETLRVAVLALGTAAAAAGWLAAWRWLGGRAPAGGGGRVAVRAVVTAAVFAGALLASSALREGGIPPASPLLALAAEAAEPEEALAPGCLPVADLTPLSGAGGGEVPAGVAPPASRGAAPPRPVSLLLVAVESLRADVPHLEHQGQQVMPHLDRLAGEGLLLTRVWSTSTHSDYADPAALSGLYPLWGRRHRYYERDDPWPRRLIWDHLVPHGYATALVSSQNESWGGMDAFLRTPGLHWFYDSRVAAAQGVETRAPPGDEALVRLAARDRRRAGKLDDAVTVAAALRWLGGLPAERPFVLAVNLQSTHFPYQLAESAPRPFAPGEIDFPVSFSGYPPGRIPVVRNAYFNALHYVDLQIARLLGGLEALGHAERTLVVVYGENGELFGEQGLFTHAGAPFEPALRVPVVLRGPRVDPGKEPYPASLVDLVPTVLGRLGLAAPPSVQGIDLLAPAPPPAGERPIYFHNENPWSRVDGVVMGGRWKLWVDREDERVRLYDLRSDPGEERELAARRPELAARLATLVADWRCRQLAYYENPFLYGRHWPPPPPPPRWRVPLADPAP